MKILDGHLMADAADFSPPLIRIQRTPPAPLAGRMLWVLIALLSALMAWAVFAHVDIVAVAEGKLVPSSYLKIVQPAEQGIVKAILVKEGEAVRAGQVLIRMDSVLADADVRAVQTEHHNRRLALRRIDAQLSGKPLTRQPNDRPELYAHVNAQYDANVRAHENALAHERTLLDKARQEVAAGFATKAKLEQVLPHYVEQEKAYEKLTRDGFAGRILYTDKQRQRIEKEQDLRTQEFTIRSIESQIEQSERKIAHLQADYRRQLHAERIEVLAQLEKGSQELAKLAHRHGLLELRAPQAGIVKDLATHTVGTVASPGTVLMTLVPHEDNLVAEVWVSNDDVGFVRTGQEVKLKLAAFQFQKYGLLPGHVLQINPDSTDSPTPGNRSEVRDRPVAPLAYRALVGLERQQLVADGYRHALQPGMQVAAEIHLGTRTILEYVLSPVQKAFHEAARER